MIHIYLSQNGQPKSGGNQRKKSVVNTDISEHSFYDSKCDCLLSVLITSNKGLQDKRSIEDGACPDGAQRSSKPLPISLIRSDMVT